MPPQDESGPVSAATPLLRGLLRAGVSRSAAARAVADVLGLPRNAVKRLASELDDGSNRPGEGEEEVGEGGGGSGAAPAERGG